MHDHLGDRLANSISHGIGVIISIIGSIFLLFQTSGVKDTFAVTLYGVSLICLYLFSTIHHSIKMPTKEGFYKLQSLDQIGIYFLIVGTYTPFIIIGIESSSAIVLFITLWIITIIGIIFKIIWPSKGMVFHVISYVVMGWSIVVLWSDLTSYVDLQVIRLIVIGGILYTGGIPFYIISQIKKNWHYTHLIWHLFVLSGSIVHFYGVTLLLK